MEGWRKARQHRVWTAKKVRALEKRYGTMHQHHVLMQTAATMVVGSTVLDVGCGLGHFYEYVKAQHPSISYVGADQSGPMLQRAHLRYPHAIFMRKNVYELDLPTCDTVVCLDMLHHQPTLEPAFSILMKHARKRLIVSLWIHERYKKGKHKKTYIGQSGEVVTWHTEKELQDKFKGLTYVVTRGVGWSWRDLYCFYISQPQKLET